MAGRRKLHGYRNWVDAAGGVNQSISGTEQAGGCKQERCSDVKGQVMGSHCDFKEREAAG